MGVHDLLPLLRKAAPSCFTSVDAWRAAAGLAAPIAVAVDTPIFMYKYAYSVGTGTRLTARMLRLVDEMVERGFAPTFVFDGAPLPQKDRERARRRACSDRASALLQLQHLLPVSLLDEQIEVDRAPCAAIQPARDDYDAVKQALTRAGVPVEHAAHEAEARCAHLCASGRAQAVITEDSDALAYLCCAAILHWGSPGEQVVSAPAACAALQLAPLQFQDLCVLMGNDFNARIRGIGPVKALDLLRRFKNIEGVLAWLESSSYAPMLALEPSDRQRLLESRRIFCNTCFEL
jgi:flap endonuclease-1